MKIPKTFVALYEISKGKLKTHSEMTSPTLDGQGQDLAICVIPSSEPCVIWFNTEMTSQSGPWQKDTLAYRFSVSGSFVRICYTIAHSSVPEI